MWTRQKNASGEPLGIFDENALQEFVYHRVKVDLPDYYDWGQGCYLVRIDSEKALRRFPRSVTSYYLRAGEHRFRISSSPRTPSKIDETVMIDGNVTLKVTLSGIIKKLHLSIKK